MNTPPANRRVQVELASVGVYDGFRTSGASMEVYFDHDTTDKILRDMHERFRGQSRYGTTELYWAINDDDDDVLAIVSYERDRAEIANIEVRGPGPHGWYLIDFERLTVHTRYFDV